MIRHTAGIRKNCIIFIVFALLGASALAFESNLSAIYAQAPVLRHTVLEGALPSQSSKHYFGLAPTIRDGWVVVTLAYEPRADLSLSGQVNFSILTEDGLRRYLAGSAIIQSSIASGGRVSYDRVGNKLQASFKDSGRGDYTVIVYNNSAQPVTYMLAVEGGELIDENGQTATTVAASPPVQPVVQASDVTVDDTKQEISVESADSIYPEIRALRVSSSLGPTLDKHYLTVEPASSNSIVSLNMQYGPLNEPALDHNVNFYVLTEDGFRRLVHGDRPENVNIAVGFPSPYPNKPNELLAGFQAAGRGPYTVVISNRAALPVSYQMSSSQAVLIDQYGQTNEAKAALAEYAAIQNAQQETQGGIIDLPVVSEESETTQANANLILAGSIADTGANQRSIELENQFNLPYQHHYYGLEPTISNGRVQVTLAYALTPEELSINPPNFWVLDEDGMRRVVSGARPMDVNLANGAMVMYGEDKGKLSATFDTSGKGPYTIVIDNNSNSTAAYQVRVSGGFLTQAPANSDVLLALP